METQTYPLLPESVTSFRSFRRGERGASVQATFQEVRRQNPTTGLAEFLGQAELVRRSPVALSARGEDKRDQLLESVRVQARRVDAGLPVMRDRVEAAMATLEPDELPVDEAIPFSQLRGEVV